MRLRIDTTSPPAASHRGNTPSATPARAVRNDGPGAPGANDPGRSRRPTDPAPPSSAEAAAALARQVAAQLAQHGETAMRAQGSLAAAVVCHLLED